jgi:large subunit ribosomal protein L11
MLKKKLKIIVKLNIQANNATPTPPIGPILGQHGVNILNFCKEYNLKTQNLEGIVPAKLYIYEDRSYFLKLKTNPITYLLCKYSNIKKGSSKPNKEFIGNISISDIIKIAEIKLKDLNTNNLDNAKLIIIGTAKNMGLKIVN